MINKDGNIEVNCDICGKPITHTDKYGMWCEDECGREEAMKDMTKIFGKIEELFGVDFSKYFAEEDKEETN
jgi:ribosomal protein L37AE/L43A